MSGMNEEGVILRKMAQEEFLDDIVEEAPRTAREYFLREREQADKSSETSIDRWFTTILIVTGIGWLASTFPWVMSLWFEF